MTEVPSPAYGEAVEWEPERPRFKPLRLLLSWMLTAASLWVAAAILPGVDIVGYPGALAGRDRHRDPECTAPTRAGGVAPAVHARARLRARPDTQRLGARVRVPGAGQHLRGGQLRLGAARGARGRSRERRARGHLRDERRRHVHAARRPANRPPPGWRGAKRGSRHHLPRDRRARASGAPQGDAGRQRDQHGPLALGRHASPRPSGRPISRRRPGASQAGILLGSNDDIPAFRWVDKETGKLTACSNPADCARIEAERATGIGLLINGGVEPRQPALGRGRGSHSHRQPHGRREAREPGLSRVLRQRVQRHAIARPVRVGGHPRVDGFAPRDPPRRAPERPPRRHLPVPAGRDVRDRPRPDRVRRAHGRDARHARPSTPRSRATTRSHTTRGSSGRTRSKRFASSTSSSAASSARCATRRAPTRSSCSRITGRRKERRSSSATATGSTSSSSARSSTGASRRSPTATSRTRWSGSRSARPPAARRSVQEAREARRLGQARHRARLGKPRTDLADGGATQAHARGDRRASSAADPGTPRAPARRLAARPVLGARSRRTRSCRRPLPRRRHRRGRGPARSLSLRTRRVICCAPTGSRTWPTSWSAASTTRISKRAVPSRS